ncbi:hypothetical protein BBJ28_00008096 [Nothophytophthora sp. Chile5]|nr:hypothetical protein BBJ28_00008096 [Nothophytophthora sp. Chile5]
MRAIGVALLAAVAAPAVVRGQTVVSVGNTGGWRPANVTEANTQVLVDALTGDYAKSVGAIRVCYTEITALQTQVVAGTNYRFYVTGCDVTGSDSDGACDADSLTTCTLADYVVQIFEQSWTETLKVTHITEVENSSSDSGSDEDDVATVSAANMKQPLTMEAREVSPDEKAAIETWIQANNLNQFGDEATMMYMGGTPLFDENTGVVLDRYAYILSRHPDQPWLARAEAATLLAASEPEPDTQGDGSVAGVLAMLGVFTVVLAGVALGKMHQARRQSRFRYNSINSREA